MSKFLRVGAMTIVCMLLLTLGVFAKETKGESSALINLQLENISQSQGREQAQKMLLSTLDMVKADTQAVAVGQTTALAAADIQAQTQTQSQRSGGMEFSLAGVAAFAALALLLVVIIYIGLVFWRRSEKAPVRTPVSAKRFSLD